MSSTRRWAAAALLGLAVAAAPQAVPAKDLRAPARPNDDQSYLYLDPGSARPNPPGYLGLSMDPGNDPDTGTMFGQDEQDISPSPFGLHGGAAELGY